jgi:hypothetical protein
MTAKRGYISIGNLERGVALRRANKFLFIYRNIYKSKFGVVSLFLFLNSRGYVVRARGLYLSLSSPLI